MRTGFKIAVVVGLASLVLAGVALAGWGGGGYRRGGGPGPGLQGGAPADQQNQAPWMGRGPWGGASGPQMGPGGPDRGAGPQMNNPLASGGNYGFCPRCGAPCPAGGWAAPGAGPGYGPVAGRGPRFGRGGGPGLGFQGGPMGPQGQGFGRRNMMRRPGPMNGGWGRGFGPGPGGEGFQPQNTTPWGGRGGQGWRQPGNNTNEPGPQVAPPGQSPDGPDRGGLWSPPRGGAWRGRGGRGLRPWDGPGIGAPEGANQGGPGPAPTDKPPVTPDADGTGQPKPQ